MTFSTLSTGLTMGTKMTICMPLLLVSFSTLSTGLTMGTPLGPHLIGDLISPFSTLSTGLTMGTGFQGDSVINYTNNFQYPIHGSDHGNRSVESATIACPWLSVPYPRV